MVYFYYIKFTVVLPSKDALIVNNVYSEHYEVMATVNIMKVFFGINLKK